MKPRKIESEKAKRETEEILILRRGKRILSQLLRRIPAADLDQLMVTTNEVEYLLELCRLAIKDGWSYGVRAARNKQRRRGRDARQKPEKVVSVRYIRKPKP